MRSKQLPSREAVFAEAVKQYRQDKSWTQTDLAKAMKAEGFTFHQQTIQRIENGDRPVRLDEAYALAEILGTDVDTMSRSLEAMRAGEVAKALVGALSIADGAWRGRDGWFADASSLAAHIEFELEHGRRTERVLAGLAILERAARAADEVVQATDVSVTEFLNVAVQRGAMSDVSEDDEEPTPEYERQLRELLKAHRVPPRLKKLSLADLTNLCLPTASAQGDE